MYAVLLIRPVDAQLDKLVRKVARPLLVCIRNCLGEEEEERKTIEQMIRV